MGTRELKIKELENILLKELYEEYRKNSAIMPDGKDYFEHIREKYRNQFIINRNDFIISLDHLAALGCVKLEKTTDSEMPLYFKINPTIIDYIEGLPDSLINNIPKSYNNVSEKYIKLSCSDYGLNHYDAFIDLINKAISYNDFYKLIPFLLRCLFENLLYEIFQVSLKNHYKDLYFMKDQNRPRDFAQLINLLNFLKDNEYRHITRDSINPRTIQILEKIKKIGNYAVHDVIEKVSKREVEEWNEDIHLVLKPLLVSYKKLEKAEIKIGEKRLNKIKQKLGIIPQLDDDIKEFEVEDEDFIFNIDFSLIELYSQMIEKGDIDQENIISTLESIRKQLSKLRYTSDLNQNQLSIIETMCLIFKKLIKEKDNSTKDSILYILLQLIDNKLTEEILKKHFLEIIQILFESGEMNSDIIRILDHFGYFKKILKFLNEAIDKNDLNLLKAYHSNLNYSKFRDNRLEIIKELKKKIANLNSIDENLKKFIQKIIHKFENIE